MTAIKYKPRSGAYEKLVALSNFDWNGHVGEQAALRVLNKQICSYYRPMSGEVLCASGTADSDHELYTSACLDFSDGRPCPMLFSDALLDRPKPRNKS